LAHLGENALSLDLRAGLLAALSVLLVSCGGGGDDGDETRELLSLSIQPGSTSTVDMGSTLQYKVVAGYSDGSTSDVTATVTLSSSDTSIAEINASGLATARAPGTVSIRATLEDRTSTATLIVPATLIWDAANWGDFDWA
jgi:hypothetical protein